MSERSERIIVAGSPRSGEQLTGVPLVGRLEPSRGPGAPVRYDVVVIGARAAGAATALLLARAGLAVWLVDRAADGSATRSTHALMRGGELQLCRWGVLERVIAAGTPPVRQATFRYDGQVVPIAIKPAHGVRGSRKIIPP